MSTIDAVVIGGGVNALGVLRALSSHGVKCALVCRALQTPAAASRHARRVAVVPGAGPLEPQLLLKSLGLSFGEATLFFTEERDVQDALHEVDAWREAFRTYLYTPDLAAALLDKAQCDALALSAGLPAPVTAVLRDSNHLSALDVLRFPVVLKPAIRHDGYASRFKKAYRVSHRAELDKLLADMWTLGIELLVQEWIEGDDTDLYFNLLYVDRHGQLLDSFVGRKALCWPPNVGGTAACVAAPESHVDVTVQSERFLAHIGFRGLIGIEYKRDSRDGRFYLIEPTVYRTDYQHEVAALNGSSWLATAHFDMLGQGRPAPMAYGGEVAWVDFPASRYSHQTLAPTRDLMQGLRRREAHWRWSDPQPGMQHFKTLLLQRLRRSERTVG